MKTYTLVDTINQRAISRHFSLPAAILAQQEHLESFRRANGRSSYLSYKITANDGSDLSSQIEQASVALARQAAVGIYFTSAELDSE